ncbi:hypothetical protein RchiOBHm_Chr2g0134851 [Rosa chinensis]|uniref:Uncharacterized protein n=1 Tax=Rosa chinensis TaxID=74649 RepID=A0A2P6RVY5_ROSCH|nr:hypothetical protein RchiOBHm_Chr2g0134851 [Rosa chinensis]
MADFGRLFWPFAVAFCADPGKAWVLERLGDGAGLWGSRHCWLMAELNGAARDEVVEVLASWRGLWAALHRRLQAWWSCGMGLSC